MDHDSPGRSPGTKLHEWGEYLQRWFLGLKGMRSMRTLRQKRRSRVRTNQKKVVKTTFQFQAIYANQTLLQKDVTESAPLPSRRDAKNLKLFDELIEM